MLMKKVIKVLSIVLIVSTGVVSSTYAQTMSTDEKAVAENFKKIVKDTVKKDLVPTAKKTKFPEIYEIVVDNQIQGYVDKNLNYFFAGGQLLDGKTFENLTAAREEILNRVDIASLPLKQAITIKKGNGKRVLYTVEDPRCTYCKKLASELETMNDVTVHIFPVGFLGPDSVKKAKQIMCDKSPEKAWFDILLRGKTPANEGTCKNDYVDANGELARKLNIRGTPAIIFADGSRSAGYMPLDEIEKKLATIK